MKKILVATLSILLIISILASCGASDNNQSEPQEQAVEEQVHETHYTEIQTEMSNYMNSGMINISDGWIYSIGANENYDNVAFIKMREDGTDKTVLFDGVIPQYITINGEFIYAVLTADDENKSIYRMRLGGDDQEKLVDNASYLRIYDGSLYYCTIDASSGKTTAFCKSDLEGNNQEKVLDKEVYYPFIIGNELYYQDDADGETIHKYDLSTEEDVRITDTHTYRYILNDDYMYCVERSDNDEDHIGSVAKIDLATLEKTVLYEGAWTYSMAVSEEELFPNGVPTWEVEKIRIN